MKDLRVDLRQDGGSGSGGGEAAGPGNGRTGQPTRGRDSTSLAWLQERKRGRGSDFGLRPKDKISGDWGKHC